MALEASEGKHLGVHVLDGSGGGGGGGGRGTQKLSAFAYRHHLEARVGVVEKDGGEAALVVRGGGREVREGKPAQIVGEFTGGLPRLLGEARHILYVCMYVSVGSSLVKFWDLSARVRARILKNLLVEKSSSISYHSPHTQTQTPHTPISGPS